MSCRLAPAAAPAIDTARAACVTVWLLRTPAWRSRLPALLRHVDAAQRRRCNSLRVARQRDDRLLAQALHRVVLAGALDQAPDEVPLYRAASGQPRLALPGLYTSLSHADGVIAIALSRGGPVGVDVEMPDRPSLRPIADLVCAPGEDIGDDQILLSAHRGRLVCAAPAAIAGLAEVRGLGPQPVRYEAKAPVDLVIRLVGRSAAERFPEAETEVLLGCHVPLMRLAADDRQAAAMAVAARLWLPPFG